MGRIILVHIINSYNMAATQRILSYARHFVGTGVDVSLVLAYMQPFECPKFDVKGIQLEYVYERSHSSRILSKVALQKKIIHKIKELSSPKNCVVFSYGIHLYACILKIKKFKHIAEQTEIFFKTGFSGKARKIYGIFAAKKLLDGLVVISESLRDYFIGIGVKNVIISNMFVDVRRFESALTTVAPLPIVCYCGLISASKDGVDILIRSFSIFRRKHQEYKLKLIGCFASQRDRELLNDIVTELDLKNFVTFTGAIAADKMPFELCGAKILALARPNNYQSRFGFPTKLGEYLASSRPVVVTRVGEIDRFLEDKVTCFFATPDSVEDFAEKLSWVADNYQKAEVVGTTGRILVDSVFSSVVQSNIVLEFLKKQIH